MWSNIPIKVVSQQSTHTNCHIIRSTSAPHGPIMFRHLAPSEHAKWRNQMLPCRPSICLMSSSNQRPCQQPHHRPVNCHVIHLVNCHVIVVVGAIVGKCREKFQKILKNHYNSIVTPKNYQKIFVGKLDKIFPSIPNLHLKTKKEWYRKKILFIFPLTKLKHKEHHCRL